MRGVRGATLGALAIVGSLLLGTLGFVSAGAAASPVPADTAATGWAYGVTRTSSVTVPTVNGTATISTMVGYHMVMTQTTPNATTESVQATRTAVDSFQYRGCAPTCLASPRSVVNISVHSSEVDTVFANFTRSGEVVENGSTVPALGLVNTHAVMHANLTENWSAVLRSALAGLRTPRAAIAVRASTQETTEFDPALGIVPASVAPGARWNATSAAATTGAWMVDYTFTNTSAAGVVQNQSAAPHGGTSGTQTLALLGVDAGPVTLTGGVVTQAIFINGTGNFHTREGFIFLPSQSDLFGESHGPWEPLEAGQAVASTLAIDYDPNSGHLGLLASATVFGSQTTAAAPAVAFRPLAVPATGSASVLQAEPESYAQGQQNSQCLLGACPSGPSPGASGSGPSFDRGWIAVLGVGAAAGAVGAVLAVDRRRQIPATPKAAGTRYPPQAMLAASDGRGGNRPRDSPVEPKDPLENLW